MIDHISIGVRDLTSSTAFYECVLAPLGLAKLVTASDRTGFGKAYPEFWLNARPGMARIDDATGSHVCLRARSVDVVAAFHAAALANGGSCDGAPGLRRATMTSYYGAFIRDPDGHRIEVMTVPSDGTFA